MGLQRFLHLAALTVQNHENTDPPRGRHGARFRIPRRRQARQRSRQGHGHGQGSGNKHAYGYEKHGQGARNGYGVGGCPPGLAKKATACVPPGQAKTRKARKLFNVG
jgi:hypothetical protein